MFGKLLIATDLSPASDCLLQCAGELKQIGMQEAVLAHVIYLAYPPGRDDTMRAEAAPALRRQKEALVTEGIEVLAEMPVGLPANTVLELADRHDVDAILVGSHGKGIVRAATLGSVTARLIQLAARPLLIARLQLLAEDRCGLVCGRLFASILFATDFSEAAERALDYVAAIAAGTGCPVTLLHVRDSAPAKPQLDDEGVRFLLDAKRGRLERKGAGRVVAELLAGDPAEEIIRQAREAGFSLVVMGSHGKGAVKELFVGSVANAVVRQVDKPVLLIPPRREMII